MRPDTTSAIRAQLIAAMERRAAALDGEARRALDARLAERRSPDADAPDADAPDEAPDAGASPAHPGPLRELVDQLTCERSSGRAVYPDIPALADFRQLWSSLRADSQLRQSAAHAATDAGPLNSTALASRAMALMRELSPDYLRSFITYVDELAWLKALGSTSPATGSAAPKKRAPRKRHTS
jgi:hypothetical protein